MKMNIAKVFAVSSLIITAAAPGVLFAQNNDVAALQAQIAALLAQVQQLQAQLQAAQGDSQPVFCYTFNKNLGVGSSGKDVVALQQALIMEGLLKGDPFSGPFQDEFDESIAETVVSFQAKYKIRQTGFVGPLTRAKLNALYACGERREDRQSGAFVDLKTTAEYSNGNQSAFITATIAGAPQNRSIEYWTLDIRCASGVVMPGADGKELCGTRQTYYASNIFDVTQDYLALTVSANNNSDFDSPYVNFVLTAYRGNGNVVAGYDKEGIPLGFTNPGTVSEQVKCVFNGSNKKENCWSRISGQPEGTGFSCSGIGTCVANVSGPSGTSLAWTGSCGGFGYTTMDGQTEWANFNCGATQPSVYQALPTDPNISGSASLVSANENITRVQFGLFDFKWQVDITNNGSVAKTIKRMILVHKTPGEGWATDESASNPVGKALYQLGTTITSTCPANRENCDLYYTNNLGAQIEAGQKINFFAYGDPGSRQFTGGYLLIEFIDNTSASISVSGSNIPTSEPSITVTYPNGGETFPPGSTQQFTWRSTGISKDNFVTLRLRGVDDGREYQLKSAEGAEVFLTNTPNDGSQLVIIGQDYPDQGYRAEVKTAWSGRSYLDSSDSYFKITTVAGANRPPQLLSGTGPGNVQVGQQATFNWTADDSDGDNLSWSVSFGDGVGSAGVCPSNIPNRGYSASRTYSVPGTYTVTVTVSDCKGGTASKGLSVTVNATTQPSIFQPGDRVQPTQSNTVYSGPSLTDQNLGTQNTGSQGAVVSGGNTAWGYTWWNVNFDSGADGWVIGSYLAKVAVQPSITVLSPNGGEEVPVGGAPLEVSWTSSGVPEGTQVLMQIWKGGNVIHSAYVDNDGNETFFVLSTFGFGSDFTLGILYKTSDGRTYADRSDGYFTITPGPTPAQPSITVGDRVQSTQSITVFSGPSLTDQNLGTQNTGSQGAVVSGGNTAWGYTWWNVNFDSGADGWIPAQYLTKIITPSYPAAGGSSSNTEMASVLESMKALLLQLGGAL